MTEQAFRYPKDTWSESEARSHCKDHEGTFEAAAEEDAITRIRSKLPETEYRYAAGELEMRDSKKGLGIRGFIPFDSESEDIFGFTEKIHASAFDKTLRNKRDIVSSWNHDPLWVLGRKSNKTLKLAVAEEGLEYDVSLDEDDPIHRHFARRVERRDVVGSSFTFSAVREQWTSPEKEGENPTRELLEIKLYEIGPVTYPAYPKSGAQARALCDVASIRCGEDLELTDLASVICRSKDGKLANAEDVELMHLWLARLVTYLPRGVVSSAELKVRDRQLRQKIARYGLVTG
jgi:hypothetical protein